MAAPHRPHRRPKLTPSQVDEIRQAGYRQTARQLAEQYGVHFRTIEKVRHGQTWRAAQ